MLDRHAEQQAIQLSFLPREDCFRCKLRSVFPIFLSIAKSNITNDMTIDNLDTEQAAFLKKWFPDEVKNKQRYNEMMAGVDQYGEVYASEKCVVM
jgi:hypothetical protein